MNQIARNHTDAADGFPRGYRYVIQDRSSPFTEQFRETLKTAGVNSLKFPARTTNLNSVAERFLRTVKESCLDNTILFGESSLREAVCQLVENCHQERNHQGIENKIIRPEFAEFPKSGTIRSRRRLGGLLRYDYRDVA